MKKKKENSLFFVKSAVRFLLLLIDCGRHGVRLSVEKVIRRLVAQLPPFLIVSTSAAAAAVAEALSALFIIAAAAVIVVGLQVVAQFVSTKVQETVALFGPFTTVSVRLLCRFTVNKVHGFYASGSMAYAGKKREIKRKGQFDIILLIKEKRGV